jgi:hypothetical protein
MSLLALVAAGLCPAGAASIESSSVIPECPHCVVMAPWNFDDRHDWPVNFTNVCFDMQFIAWGPYFNDSTQPLPAGSVRGAYLNKQKAGVSNLLRADHIFWSWMAHSSAAGSCKWPAASMICTDWRERWLSVHAALQPFIANKTYEGVFLGDELLDSGLPLSNLTSAVQLVRSTWPDAVIAINEGFEVMITGGYNGGAITPTHSSMPHTVHNGWVSDDPDWKLPAELDLISIDYYCSFSTCRGNFTPCPTGLNGPNSGPQYDLSFDSNCAGMIRNIYERFVFPRIPSGAKTKAILVPSAQAASGRSPPCPGYAHPICDNPLNASDGHVYDELWAKHALDLWAWASEDTRVVGFAPYHFADEPSFGSVDGIGFRNLPQTLSVWTELGLKITSNARPGATTLREQLKVAAQIGDAATRKRDG